MASVLLDSFLTTYLSGSCVCACVCVCVEPPPKISETTGRMTMKFLPDGKLS